MAGGPVSKEPPTMALGTAAIYIFNLIVGTGALALPAAFQNAGWILGSVLLLLLGFTSYITATWVIEAMAACNGIVWFSSRLEQQRPNREGESEDQDNEGNRQSDIDTVNYFDDDDFDGHGDSDRRYLVRQDHVGQIDVTNYGSGNINGSNSVCHLNVQLELAAMADLLYNKLGKILFSICIILYLYGDLAIYCTAIAKSFRDVSCTVKQEVNCSANGSQSSEELGTSDICWETSSITRQDVYRIYVAAFLVLLGPFTFFNITKTKYLQMVTTLLRWTAFTAMVVLASMRIADSSKTNGQPIAYDFTSIPAVFGVSVYAFMCHHSIPSLISPVKRKSSIVATLAVDYLLIAGFYLILSITGVFAFPVIPDLYTLAFKPNKCATEGPFQEAVDYFLALFPVFTLSTNFPIIGITLRNNLNSLFGDHLAGCLFGADQDSQEVQRKSNLVRKVVFPLMAVIPPALIALSTENLGILVTITGAYAGAGIQYVIPASLVWLGRKRLSQLAEQVDRPDLLANPFRGAVFGHGFFLLLVLTWTLMAIGLVTSNFILKAV